MVSPSGPKLLGYGSSEEIIGHKLSEVFYPSPEERRKFLETIHSKQEVTDYEMIIKKHDGTPIVVSMNSQVLQDSEGNSTGVEGIFQGHLTP